MLEKVKQYALEKYAGDESLIKEFVEGFEKAAANGGGTGKTLEKAPESITNSLKKGIGEQLGKGISGLILTSGVGATAYAYNQLKQNNLHTKFLQSLEKAIATNRILMDADRGRVKGYADTVFRFAPNVASDVNLLSSILANAVHGESIDPMTIKTLTELENRFTSNIDVMGSVKSFV